MFAPAFRRNSRWSIAQPVPEVGDDSTPYAAADAFYNFWFTFRSWREFPHPDEEDVEQAESREERRWASHHLPQASLALGCTAGPSAISCRGGSGWGAPDVQDFCRPARVASSGVSMHWGRAPLCWNGFLDVCTSHALLALSGDMWHRQHHDCLPPYKTRLLLLFLIFS